MKIKATTPAEPIHEYGVCSFECPYFRDQGERPAKCTKLKTTLGYYKGWQAVCENLPETRMKDGGGPQAVRRFPVDGGSPGETREVVWVPRDSVVIKTKSAGEALMKFFTGLYTLVTQVVLGLGCVAAICALFWFAYWCWAINHPGAPWWGYFLSGE